MFVSLNSRVVSASLFTLYDHHRYLNVNRGVDSFNLVKNAVLVRMFIFRCLYPWVGVCQDFVLEQCALVALDSVNEGVYALPVKTQQEFAFGRQGALNCQVFIAFKYLVM